MAEPDNRRPLASRQTAWAGRAARWLAASAITPNQISIAGMVAAAVGGLCLWAGGGAQGGAQGGLYLMGALFCQIRLLCNLLDGMVAVEGGRGAPDGLFWNELPDRVSDLFLLMGAALGLGAPALGWAAVSFAFLTAYVRELGVHCGLKADFVGPMAKQHRMALLTGAAVATAFQGFWAGTGETGGLMTAALWIIAVGAALTALRRCVRLVRALKTKAPAP